MEKILACFVLFIVCVFLLSLIEENLNNKFIKIGVFNNLKYSDFVKKIRKPNQIINGDNVFIAVWYSSNFIQSSYKIALVFDNEGNFIQKNSESIIS
jgi:hypothetical protein